MVMDEVRLMADPGAKLCRRTVPDPFGLYLQPSVFE